MSLAIIFSVCGAFATRPKFDCHQAPQYWFTGGGSYMPAGVYGYNYICVQGSTVCTYFTVDQINFYPCELGQYMPCDGCLVKDSAAKRTSPVPSH
jgi:hypothetical protein